MTPYGIQLIHHKRNHTETDFSVMLITLGKQYVYSALQLINL